MSTIVEKWIEVDRMEQITLECNDTHGDLTVTEFFELVGELYEELGYSNQVTVKIKGLSPKFKNKLKFNPIHKWELHIDDDEWSNE